MICEQMVRYLSNNVPIVYDLSIGIIRKQDANLFIFVNHLFMHSFIPHKLEQILKTKLIFFVVLIAIYKRLYAWKVLINVTEQMSYTLCIVFRRLQAQ